MAPPPPDPQLRIAELEAALAAQQRRLNGMLTIAANLARSREPRRAMRAIVAGNPFPDTERVSVVFLAGLPSAERLARLDPQRSPGDELVAAGTEIYLRQPNGSADSKLTNAYFDSTLATVSTGRNWRTVCKLLELAGG